MKKFLSQLFGSRSASPGSQNTENVLLVLTVGAEKIVSTLLQDFKNASSVDLSKDPVAMKRLREAAVQADLTLEKSPTATVNLPFIAASPSGPLHLVQKVQR